MGRDATPKDSSAAGKVDGDTRRRLLDAAAEIRASGAVVVLGAGGSLPAGMPLAAHLPPLVWLALDENPAVRRQLAASMGVPDAGAKLMVCDDPVRITEAFHFIAADADARATFQTAFVRLDEDRAKQPSVTHTAIAWLLHRGYIDCVVSLNWDSLLEVAWERTYDISINSTATRLYKPHGDVRLPNHPWVLPNEVVPISPALVSYLSQMARERPRVLLVVGYSERDEAIVQQVVQLLADRWRVIRISPGAAGEGAVSVPAEIALPLILDELCQAQETPGWEWVTFRDQHDLGPAIAGQRLGPADVAACPKLPQAESVHRMLSTTNRALVTGRAGCGKSITAFHVGHDLLCEGWEILRPSGQDVPEHTLLNTAMMLTHRSVLIVDDAQLRTDDFKAHIMELATPERKVMVVATDETVERSRAVYIPSEAAVEALATSFRARRSEVLPVVRKFDSRIGEGYMDVSIDDRIKEASREHTPWQFTFVLRGGWSTAKEEIRILREQDRADLLLVAIAARQILTADSAVPPCYSRIVAQHLSRTNTWADRSLDALKARQVVFGDEGLRCAHIRFAAVVLRCFWGHRCGPDERAMISLLNEMIIEPSHPLTGLGWLLHELRFSESHYFLQHNGFASADVRDKLVARALNASSPPDRGRAALVLDELTGWTEDGYQGLVKHWDTIARWIEMADADSAYGLGWIVNSAHNCDESLADDLVARTSAKTVAEHFSHLDPSDGYVWGHLLDRLALGADDPWRHEFGASLDRQYLIKLVSNCDPCRLLELASMLASLTYYDLDFSYQLLDAALPVIKAAVAMSPIRAWKDMEHELFWLMLGHAPDFLRSRRPDGRQKRYSRKIARCFDAKQVAADLSSSRQREWETYAHFFGWLQEVDRHRSVETIAAVDLRNLEKAAGGLWARPPRDLRMLLLCLASTDQYEPARSWLHDHADDIEVVDPIVARIAPEVAVAISVRGGTIDLFGHNGSWEGATYALSAIADVDEATARRAVMESAQHIAGDVSDLQDIDCDGIALFFEVVAKLDSDLPRRLVQAIDTSKAEARWLAQLKGKAKCVRSVAVLVRIAVTCGGTVGEMARRVESRLPKRVRPEE